MKIYYKKLETLRRYNKLAGNIRVINKIVIFPYHSTLRPANKKGFVFLPALLSRKLYHSSAYGDILKRIYDVTSSRYTVAKECQRQLVGSIEAKIYELSLLFMSGRPSRNILMTDKRIRDNLEM